MVKNRILLGIWILLVCSGTIVLNNYGMLIILVLSIIIPILDVFFARLSATGIEAEITSVTSAFKGDKLKYTLKVENSRITGCTHGKAVIEIKNLLTGSAETECVSFSVNGKSVKKFENEINTDYCGKIQIELKELISEDFTGIYGKHKKCHNRTYSLVMPDTFPVDIEIGVGNQCNINSDEFSMYKPGNDPSETFAIREYRPGDKIKNIHWKLSEKLDEITVRELGLPVNNSVLLILDSLKTSEKDNWEKVMDNLGECVISVAQVLSFQNIPFTLSWHDMESDQMKQNEILNNNDLAEHISDVLSASPFEGKNDILEEYEIDIGYAEFAHIIIVTGNEGSDKVDSYDERNITRLICNESDNLSEKFMYVEV